MNQFTFIFKKKSKSLFSTLYLPVVYRVIVVCLVTSVGLVSVSRDRAVRRESKATLDLRASENQASRDSEARQENKVSSSKVVVIFL